MTDREMMDMLTERDAWRKSAEVLQKVLTTQVEHNARLVDANRHLCSLLEKPMVVSGLPFARIFDPSGHDVSPAFPPSPTCDEYLATIILDALRSLPEEQRKDYLAYVIKSARGKGGDKIDVPIPWVPIMDGLRRIIELGIPVSHQTSPSLEWRMVEMAKVAQAALDKLHGTTLADLTGEK